MSILVSTYNPENKIAWNNFIATAKNSTFLFTREYMDYHQDRFIDYSVMVQIETKIVAVLPANLEGDIVVSHAGLTYGGFILDIDSSVEKNLLYIKLILEFLESKGIKKLKLKYLPNFFSKCSQSEIEYALFLAEAKTYRVDTALVLEYGNSFKRKMPKGRKSEITKAKRFKVSVEESATCNYFWNEILTPNLVSRFNVKPVHTLDEITLLKNNNPKNIKQFHAIVNNEIVAGTTVFETETTAHLQYLAGNDKARETGALDFLFYHLIQFYSNKKKFFDFGIVNESNGKKLNLGMLKWKESFATRVALHKFFEVNTANHTYLDINNYTI